MGYSPLNNNTCNIQPQLQKSEKHLSPYQCRDQTKKLYKFNNLVEDSSDCLLHEQIFNNFTKRKHISVGRVPLHIYNDN